MKRAFTLIELIIVISMILLMVVVAVPMFGKINNNYELENKANEIVSSIEKARAFSQSPDQGRNGSYITVTNKIVSVNYAKFPDLNCTSLEVSTGGPLCTQPINISSDPIDLSGSKIYIDNFIPTPAPTFFFITPDKVQIGNHSDIKTSFSFDIHRADVSQYYTILITSNPYKVTLTKHE